jgi:hypothetical protein
MVRRQDFVAAGGFREDLYPNEENEFLDRLQARGKKLVFDPLAQVRKPRPASLAAFLKQAFRYGRGRMRQMKFSGRWSTVHLIPLGFSCYLAVWPWWATYRTAWLPVAVYFMLLVYGTTRTPWTIACIAFWMFPLRHFSYGLGLLAGIFP